METEKAVQADGIEPIKSEEQYQEYLSHIDSMFHIEDGNDPRMDMLMALVLEVEKYENLMYSIQGWKR